MKFNIKITRERRFFKNFQRKSTTQNIRKGLEELVREQENLAERARRLCQMMDQLDNQK